MRLFLVLLVIIGIAASASGQTVPIQDGAVVRFASVEESKKLLGTTDDWVDGFSPFDRQLRMGSEAPVSREQFLEFAASSAIPWTDETVALLTGTVEAAKARLLEHGLTLPLPAEVLFVHTTGEEEGGANYTRSNAIIVSNLDSKTVEDILPNFLHELFHVMTRHDPGVRDPLYRVIGFEPCATLEYPAALMPRKISNPDGFHFEHVIEIKAEEQSHRAMMLTLSKSEMFSGGALFDYVTISMLPVETVDGVTRAVMREGAPVLFEMGQFGGYFEQIGGNTQYIIHPEEIMADNFTHAILRSEGLPNPEIVASVLEVLAAWSGQAP